MSAPPNTPPPWQDTLAQEGSRLLDAMREVTPQITEALVKYVWATGVSGLVLAVIFLLPAIVLWFITAPAMFRREKALGSPSEGGWAALGICAIIGGGFSCVVSVILLSGAIPKLLAPEGAAVMMALKALGGGQ